MRGRRLAAGLVGVAILALLVAMPRLGNALHRLRHGVRPGVQLDGVPVGGLLPDELERRLAQLASRYQRSAHAAYIDPQSGVVRPEQPGRQLDVRETARRLLSARPFEKVEPVVVPVVPPVSRRHFEPIFRGPAERPWVALAVNVDWGEEVLPALLDRLDRAQVKVTFFLTGRWARKYPELAAELSRRGHEIGNHGLQHDHPKALDDAALRRLIVDGQAVLEQRTGQRPVLFAPPYGEFDARIVRVAAEAGCYTIMWSLDTLDWQRPAPARIVERVVPRLSNGAIVLMHPTPMTLEALAPILEAIHSQGLQVVTVGHMVQGES